MEDPGLDQDHTQAKVITEPYHPLITQHPSNVLYQEISLQHIMSPQKTNQDIQDKEQMKFNLE
jgi:hypothetical protein